jgi:hypothetical protein
MRAARIRVLRINDCMLRDMIGLFVNLVINLVMNLEIRRLGKYASGI